MLDVGDYYSRFQIHDMLGGEIQSYLPQRNGQIVCGCFTKHFNPDAPEEIQVGNRPKVVKKTNLLSSQNTAIPVFMKDCARVSKSERIWRYCGQYRFKVLLDGGQLIRVAETKYADDKGIDGKSKRWEEHNKAIEIQGKEWNSFIEAHPDCVFLVAGDFNQTRDGSKQTYGTKHGRDLLSIQLNKNNLVCLTEDNFGELGKLTPDPKTGCGWFRNNIDHICISKNDFELISADAWNHFTNDGIYMSDHNGVFVDIVLHPQNK
jgi:hypothetical protein